MDLALTMNLRFVRLALLTVTIIGITAGHSVGQVRGDESSSSAVSFFHQQLDAAQDSGGRHFRRHLHRLRVEH
jgi:hypothetical protein